MATDCYEKWELAYGVEKVAHETAMAACGSSPDPHACRMAELQRHVDKINELKNAYHACVAGGGDA